MISYVSTLVKSIEFRMLSIDHVATEIVNIQNKNLNNPQSLEKAG